MEKIMELHVDKSRTDSMVEKVVWCGAEIPWEIETVDVHAEYYGGYTVNVQLRSGSMEFHPDKIEYFDHTPPAPKCDACGQDLPKNICKEVDCKVCLPDDPKTWNHEPKPKTKKKHAVVDDLKICSCGDYCYGTNWACGPNGCYNRAS